MKARLRHDVFINVPFDDEYEPLFLALIAGLVGLGFTPRSVLQIPPNQRRLERILTQIKRCAFSVHDLSRVEPSGVRDPVPRFNMPFELGLACGLASNLTTFGDCADSSNCRAKPGQGFQRIFIGRG